MEDEKDKSRDKFRKIIRKIKVSGDFLIWKIWNLDKIIREEIQNVRVIRGKFKKSVKKDKGDIEKKVVWW